MNQNILSLKLKQYRQHEGITQEDLAERLGVSDKSISKWELGKGYPSKKNIMKISELLNVSLEVLLIEEQEEDNKFKQSVKYALISYCIILSLTILVRAIKEQSQYQDILSRDFSEVIKIVAITFGQNIYIAIVPSLIIGAVFYFYILPLQKTD